MTLKAIIFDLDDTLYPERSYALSGFAAVAGWAERQFGVPQGEAFDDLRRMFEDGVRGNTFNRWLEKRSLPVETWIPEMVRQYRDHLPKLEPFPDTRPVLEALRPLYRLGLITQGYAPGQQRKLEALRLVEYFEPIVIMGEDRREDWKPSRRPFEQALAALQLEGPQGAYIGDNPVKDFYGARQLGMTTIWVRRAKGEHAGKQPPTPQHAPEIELADLAALPGVLETL